MNFLASDSLRGRGSGTIDELNADRYIEEHLRYYGIAPIGRSFIHPVVSSSVVGFDAPVLEITSKSQPRITLKDGDQLRVIAVTRGSTHGALFRIPSAASLRGVPKGSFVLLERDASADADVRYQRLLAALASGAAVVILRAPEHFESYWTKTSAGFSSPANRAAGQSGNKEGCAILMLANSEFSLVWNLKHPTARLSAHIKRQVKKTWNVLGELRGTESSKRFGVIILSAHVDHLGVKKEGNRDIIYHGADDDASGTAVVLELARILSKAPRARRTLIFAFFGGEEQGLIGSRHFIVHPPLPLQWITADIQFEMIGRKDQKIGDSVVWLTGWNRSNLGPALVAEGAKLTADPYPAQNFFQRSDNYPFAAAGIVAHTVSSFGLHADYHQPTDDMSKIDFEHIKEVITTIEPAISWLSNSEFKPDWSAGEGQD